ncbi:MAG: hypothetical protein ACRELG_17735, partial [Gemmataceae bacterium]
PAALARQPRLGGLRVVNPEARLAEIVTALEAVGLSCLVMGGHAVRYYGLQRNTNDYDLHLAPDRWPDLPHLLRQSSLFLGQPVVEGPSWRPDSFRRFPIGRLADGREEWLEFWRSNHLLPPFAELFARREEGSYGGRPLPFLGLPDLIRSKETERARDWQDVAFLEEFLDARLLAQVEQGRLALAQALEQLRSRRGFESYWQKGYLTERSSIQEALTRTHLSITQAYLLPLHTDLPILPVTTVPIEPVIVNRLRTVTPVSPLHLVLVEAVRRQYKLAAQAADRANKEAIRAAQKR